MKRWINWTMPAAVVVSAAPSAFAVEYLTIPAAQKEAFPSASFAEVQAGRIWRAESGGHTPGFFIFEPVIGKHLYIDYSVSLHPRGRNRRGEVPQYRQSCGG